MGRFELMKNHQFVVRLFFEYLNLNPKAILILIGEGSLKKNILNLVDDLNLTNNVFF